MFAAFGASGNWRKMTVKQSQRDAHEQLETQNDHREMLNDKKETQRDPRDKESERAERAFTLSRNLV